LPQLGTDKAMKQISVDRAAKIVGVSSATMRNWAKAGHIAPTKTRPLSFTEMEVMSLKNQLSSGSLQKLKTRANKVRSEENILPNEYAANNDLVENIKAIIDLVDRNKLDTEIVLFVASLRLLEIDKEVSREPATDIFDFNSFKAWQRNSTRDEIEKWRCTLGNVERKDQYATIYELLTPIVGDDYLGLLYQCLSVEGKKSEGGAYYTPSKIVEDSLHQYANSKYETFLDPCCGAGKYLIYAAKLLQLRPENIYGFDIDATAVKLARINLLRAFKCQEFSPHIYCLDSLNGLATGEMFCETNDLIGTIDIVATNPPWGAYKNCGVLPQFSNQIKSGETFSMFLAKSLSLLRSGGQLSFVLPESILKIKTHSDIRKVLLGHGNISKIAKLGQQFTGVFTPVIRLDFIKGAPNPNWLVSIEENKHVSRIEQARFLSNDNYAFDVNVSVNEEILLNKIYATDHLTLFKNAEWALGIVTGDNKRHILDVHEKNSEAVFRGADVHQFRLAEPRSFIHFTPNNFQQVAPERFFRLPEKLIYRFISKTLVFAYDDKQRLTLNSANILVPRIPDMSIKVALAYLNSSVFQYVFKKKFSTHKVLRGDMEKLPFPVIAKTVHDQIEGMVELILEGHYVREEIDELIFSTFHLSSEDVALIKNEVRN
ncbi:MAG TPA: TaqI-like C-terminal specificity domain-containing protein, partial [Candidatus Peribacteraceae bacterium]|nr:TaqI-like C-terminal specificity domain-containing protein [Candidatus Peribacteraceae bacterium]